MGKLFSALKMNIVLLLALSVIAGCGTGGLSDAPATGTTPGTTTPPTAVTVTINGRVVDGAISGATVQAYKINANGTRGDAIGTSTTTDSNGNYALSLNYNGPILVESAGGSYTDWATGKTVTLSSTDKLSAVMSNAKDAVTINITPLTHMAALRVQQDMAVNETADAAAIDTANSKIGEYYGGIDILKDTPIDPTVSNSASGVSQNRVDYALVLAGISQSAINNNVNPFSLAIALAKDASDGVFDSKQGTTQLTIANATGGGATNLSATAAKSDLSTSINVFQNSATNKSGGTITSSIPVRLSSPDNNGVIAARQDVPTGFTAVVISSTQINLSWSVSPGAAGYNIFKDGTKLKSVTTTSTSDSGLTPNTQYCYAISAYDVSGNESVQSSQLCATTNVVAPPSPTGLNITAVSSSQIDLSWTAAAGATSYKVYKGGVLLKSVTSVSTSDTDLTASTQYCYSVSASDGSGNESAQNSQLCTSTYGPPPAIPTGLTVRATSPTRVDLSWTATAGASQYKIYRNGALLAGAVVLAPATTYADTTVTADTQYSYAIVAIDATGSESSQTSQSAANTGLTVPSGITATVNSSTQITLSWTNSGGMLVTGYKVYKNETLLGAVSPVTTTNMVDSGLTASTQYCYSITATDISGNESAKSSTVCSTTQALPAPALPASMDLLVSNTQLNSDGVSTVTLTALVKDSANRAMKDQDVDFSSSSGLLTVTNEKTDANGTATATLGTGGNPTNRSITVTSTTGAINSTNTVSVTGTTIDISGLNSLSLGDSTPLTIFLKNSAGIGISKQTITVTSEKGNTLSAPSGYVTNDNGQITVNVTAAAGGPDNISAAAIGAIKDFSLTVDPNLFKITAPTVAGKEVNIGTAETITAQYKIDGNPVPNGTTVNFATTRGTLSSAAATTVGGNATVTVSSTNSGPALISAFVTGGPSAQIAIEFVAPTANKMSLQANPSVIGTNGAGMTSEKSLITAIVRDANNNLVKNKTILFTIVNDSSSGRLSPGSATTDSSGTANAYFIAGATPGAKDGVEIRATVVNTAVSATTKLTVAHKALFITLATGPTIQKILPNMYRKDYVALVTDAAGSPVKDATVSASVVPMYFRKGYYGWGGVQWGLVPTLVASSSTLPAVPACKNEDLMLKDQLYDLNGLLDVDTAGNKEDANNNDRLDPGNVASVSATPSDANGFSTVSIQYAQDYAYWVNVKLDVYASTTGDTSSASATFDLEGLAADYTDVTIRPPGYISPFGTSTTCLDTRPDPPNGLTVTASSGTQVNLSWQAPERATGYKIYRDGIFLKSVATVTSTDTGLASDTTYCYSVLAYDETGHDSAQSSQVCVTMPSLPSPTNLSITVVTSSRIDLSWSTSAGAVGYIIYRGGSYLKSVATTNASDTGLNSNIQYCYTVSAIDALGIESGRTIQLCATTPALAAPTNLAVTAATSSQINLAWTASDGASGYKIYRSGIYFRAVTVSFASDVELAANTLYCYTVSAYDSANNESPQTSQLCATTYGPSPSDPADLTVRALSPTQVDLSWTVSVGASQYKIYRNDTLLVSTASTSYTDSAAVANTQYVYRVTAIDATGSESTGQASQSTAHTGLTVPSTVTATADSSTRITVNWVNSGGALVTGYRVYKGGTLLGAFSPNTMTSIVDSGLTPNTQYCYSVKATDSSGNESPQSSTVCATTQAAPQPAYIDLLVSNPQLNSDGVSPVTLTALVKDEGHRAMAGQTVTFSTEDSGILTVVSDLTNSSGQATATLGTGGDQTNRPIKVYASIGSLSADFTVTVAGTAITISGQTNTVLYNNTTTLTLYLKDSSGNGIPGKELTLTSLYNTLTPTTVTTDASGQATTVFTATDTIPGRTDTITATSPAMNAVPGFFAVTVQNDATAKTLTFTAPTPGKEVPINTDEPVTVHYEDSSGPLAGETVNFSSTRGTIAPSAVTNLSGDAVLTVRSTTPGPAVLTGSVAGGPAATVQFEFVATNAAKINVQADPATIGVNLSGQTTQLSNIVAVVRDAENNLIKNKTINFNITRDPTAGTLSAGTAVTDSFGSASVQFIAGATSSGQDGVTISATVAGTAITATTKLTVAEKSLFVTVGTGNELRTIDPNYYQVDFGVLVTDAAGNPMAGKTVTASMIPEVYMKGYWVWTWVIPPPGTTPVGGWSQTLTLATSNHPVPPFPNTPYPWAGTPANSCANEDLTFYNDPANTSFLANGILDAGEDNNGNGRLDPGGVAAITPEAQTDANGVAKLTLTYAREYATWVKIRLDVKVLVSGTEGTASRPDFVLPGLGFDAIYEPGSPAGVSSPFGQSNSCADTL